MRLQYSKVEKITGAFVLLTLFVVLFTVAMVGRGKNWFRKHVTYYTTFQEGYNLISGSRVKLFGTDIGKVTDVVLTADNKVRIEIKVLAAYASRIRTDSVAVVESPTFIGSEYIAILPGGKGVLIEPQSEIPTREKKKFADYLEEYELEKKLNQIGDIIADLSKITSQLRESEGPLIGTMTNIQSVTRTLKAGEGTLGKMIQSDELYQKLKNELENLDDVLTSLSNSGSNFEQISGNIKKMSQNLESATRNAPEMAGNLEEILDRMLRISVLLEEAMTDVPEISRQAREGMREVNRLLDAVQKNFLIAPNLPPPPRPESHGIEIRGD
jgi:phospholipid/cholesterol/gamma-HCH transport system substrate-binding protein